MLPYLREHCIEYCSFCQECSNPFWQTVSNPIFGHYPVSTDITTFWMEKKLSVAQSGVTWLLVIHVRFFRVVLSENLSDPRSVLILLFSGFLRVIVVVLTLLQFANGSAGLRPIWFDILLLEWWLEANLDLQPGPGFQRHRCRAVGLLMQVSTFVSLWFLFHILSYLWSHALSLRFEPNYRYNFSNFNVQKIWGSNALNICWAERPTSVTRLTTTQARCNTTRS